MLKDEDSSQSVSQSVSWVLMSLGRPQCLYTNLIVWE